MGRFRIEGGEGAGSGEECSQAENRELRQIRRQLHIFRGEDAKSAAEHRAGKAERNEPPELRRHGSSPALGSRDGGLRLRRQRLGQSGSRRLEHGPCGGTRLEGSGRRYFVRSRRFVLSSGGQDA